MSAAPRLRPGRAVFAGVVVAAVAGAVVAGVVVLGPPSDARARRLDERRTADLQGAARAIDRFWARQGRLPGALADVADREGPPYASADPVTRREYDYRPLDGRRYELCAVFDRASEASGDPPRREFWRHPAGRHCFALEASPAGS